MKIADHLSKEQKQQLNKMTKTTPKKKQNKPKKKEEKVNWIEIMEMIRDRIGRAKVGDEEKWEISLSST